METRAHATLKITLTILIIAALIVLYLAGIFFLNPT